MMNVTITIFEDMETEEYTVSDSLNEYDDFSTFDEQEATEEAEGWEEDFKARGYDVTIKRT